MKKIIWLFVLVWLFFWFGKVDAWIIALNFNHTRSYEGCWDWDIWYSVTNYYANDQRMSYILWFGGCSAYDYRTFVFDRSQMMTKSVTWWASMLSSWVDLVILLQTGYKDYFYVQPLNYHNLTVSGFNWLDSTRTKLVYHWYTWQNIQLYYTGFSDPFDYNAPYYFPPTLWQYVNNWTSVVLSDLQSYKDYSTIISASTIPIWWGWSSNEGDFDFFRNVCNEDEFRAVASGFESTYNLTQSMCTSWAYSSIVNSPIQLSTRTEAQFALWSYCWALETYWSWDNFSCVLDTSVKYQTWVITSINKYYETTRSFDSSWCTSWAWSWIVNSPIKLYIRTREATDLWNYCKNITLIASWSDSLVFAPQDRVVDRFFTCSHQIDTTQFPTIFLADLPWLDLLKKTVILDFSKTRANIDILRPFSCMYNAYLFWRSEVLSTTLWSTWMNRTWQIVFKSWTRGIQSTDQQRWFLILLLNMLLWAPALYLSYKRLK